MNNGNMNSFFHLICIFIKVINKNMISRRILRAKVMQVLYAHLSSGKSFKESEKELFFSIEKSYDLLFFIIQLMIDLRDYARERIDMAQQKNIPSYQDLNPNRSFVDNRVITQIEQSRQFQKYLSDKKLSWVNYPEMIKKLYGSLLEAEYYKRYVEIKNPDFNDDKKVIEKFLIKTLPDFEPFFQNLEEQSIFWNLEVDFVVSVLARAIKQLEESEEVTGKIINDKVDEEDADFASKLFRKTVMHFDEYRGLIDEFTQNWDVDRIAFMDILIMEMAINELIEFPSIPTKVTLNEYIDMAKAFSTNNSGQFVNGILDKIIFRLSDEKKIQKRGRGLINN
ncbi:MAG: transcription antitermination factor NusB, partial [Bacteroidota bacterium]